MTRNKLVVPNAREALEEFKQEVAQEFGVTDPKTLASNHTGSIVRKLVEMGEKHLMDQYKKN